MIDGYLKCAAITPALAVARPVENARGILDELRKADSEGIKLAVFPELCLTGYTCADLFLNDALLDASLEALKLVLTGSVGTDVLFCVGLPMAVNNKVYNVAAVILGGRLLGLVPKRNLPNYSEYYEQRQFTQAPDFNQTVTLWGEDYDFGTKLIFDCAGCRGLSVAAEICEDLWVPFSPAAGAAVNGATVIMNLSAGDELVTKDSYRRSLVSQQSSRLVCGYVYASAGMGESTTDMVFSGHSIICENGSLLAERRPFTTDRCVSEIDLDRLCFERRRCNTYPSRRDGAYKHIGFAFERAERCELTRNYTCRPFVPSDERKRSEHCEAILNIQSYGLASRLRHIGIPRMVIGISGGLDSALALLVCARACDILKRPHSDILCVTMPCFGTTDRTYNNALRLCQGLGTELRTIDIKASVNQHFKDIGQDPEKLDVTYENCQARERTQVLMDLANKENGIVVGTGDLSEIALGWCTYNGDHMSMYAVNSSVPKTLVRHIVRFYADTCGDDSVRDTLYDILDTPVSPELLPPDGNGAIAQKTEEVIGKYEINDFILYHAVRWGFRPSKVYRIACRAFEGTVSDGELKKYIVNFYKRFFSQQFKRSCMPDGPKVGTVSLSPRADWRMPSDASAATWIAEAEAL